MLVLDILGRLIQGNRLVEPVLMLLDNTLEEVMALDILDHLNLDNTLVQLVLMMKGSKLEEVKV